MFTLKPVSSFRYYEVATATKAFASAMLKITMSLIALPWSNAQNGTTFTPTGEQYMDISAALQLTGQSSVVFRPMNPETSKQLYYIPFFVFKADANGKLMVKQEPADGNRVKVHIYLLVSPTHKLEEVASYIRAQETIRPDLPIFKDVQRANLIAIPLKNLAIQEESDHPVFFKYELSGYSTPGEIQLSGFVPSELSTQYIKELQNGNRLPTFRVSFDLNARITNSQSEASGNGVMVYDTEAVNKLLGSGSAFQWKIDGNRVSSEGKCITRDQKTVFEGRVRTEVSISYRLEDDKDEQLLESKLKTYFEATMPAHDINLDGTFAADLSRLSDYQFSGSDLRPDTIGKLVLDIKNFFEGNEETFTNTEVSANASFLGFGGGVGTKVERKDLRKRMEDKGWKFELQEGTEQIVPKSFSVYNLNEKLLRKEGILNVRIARGSRGLVRLENQISVAKLFELPPPNEQYVQVEELRVSVSELKSQFDDLTAEAKSLRDSIDNIYSRIQHIGANGTIINLGDNSEIRFQPDGNVLIIGKHSGKVHWSTNTGNLK